MTEAILRRFAIKNDFPLADLARILAHVISGYMPERLFDGTVVEEFDPSFDEFETFIHNYLENCPDRYKKIPILQRMFGRAVQPLTRQELEEIKKEIAEAEEEDSPEIPKVEE
jgi:hypothetical protein